MFHFQRFSDAIAHIVTVKSKGKCPVNYLDDFLFIAYLRALCNQQVEQFLEVCELLKFPISIEKTFWASTSLTFLGLLIDTVSQLVAIPVDKVECAIVLIRQVIGKKKTTVRTLQKLSGFLNFLCRCIVPGRAFTRRIYTYFASNMKPFHHLKVDKSLKADLNVWLTFLCDPVVYCRPFLDYSTVLTADILNWYINASGKIGFGGIWEKDWFYGFWPVDFLKEDPSIEYLELFAVTASVLMWGENYCNKQICLFCDNQSVVHMINASSSSCKRCMSIIRRITLASLKWNVRIFAKYVKTSENSLADALS